MKTETFGITFVNDDGEEMILRKNCEGDGFVFVIDGSEWWLEPGEEGEFVKALKSFFDSQEGDSK